MWPSAGSPLREKPALPVQEGMSGVLMGESVEPVARMRPEPIDGLARVLAAFRYHEAGNGAETCPAPLLVHVGARPLTPAETTTKAWKQWGSWFGSTPSYCHTSLCQNVSHPYSKKVAINPARNGRATT